MGILWLLAEGLIMVSVRKGVLSLSGRDHRQRPFLVFCAVSFVFLVFLRLAKVLDIDAVLGPGGVIRFPYYNGFVWNLYCTLWVIIEGAIVIYIHRVYRLISAAGSHGNADRQAAARGWGPPALALVALTVFIVYHAFLAHLLGAGALQPPAVYNVLRFYIKVCGAFWILFEWYAAVTGIKVFLLLKRSRKGSVRVD